MISRNTESQSLEQLIRLMDLYVNTAFSLSGKLADFLALPKLADWRSLEIPIKGELGNGWSYAFHGAGCCIESPEVEIDFEFDSDCEVGAFDVWRLWSFVCDNEFVRAEFSEFCDRKHLQTVFDLAVANQLIRKENDLYRLVRL